MVSFGHCDECHDLDRQGFGEAFFARHGISAIFVNGCGNHWYQYPDMIEALGTIRYALRTCPNIMTYGSDMGGYAAIRFAEHVGATAALALSPQYSCDPAKVRFETIWEEQTRQIRWRPELDGRIATTIRPIVVHAVGGNDGRHAALIADDIPIISIALSDIEEPVLAFLEGSDLFEPLLRGALEGRLDTAAFGQEAQRRSSLQLLTHAG